MSYFFTLFIYAFRVLLDHICTFSPITLDWSLYFTERIPMLKIDSATFIVQQITFLFAYAISVSVVGAFTAWLTDKMGDPTGRNHGFMTFNPGVHVNLFGMFCIVWAKIGFGNRVPIDPTYIRNPYRTLKVAIAYYSEVLASLVLAFIGLVALLILFGPSVVPMIKTLLLCADDISHMQLAQMCPTFSSARITAIYIILAIAYLNVVLAAVNLLLNSFYLYLETRSQSRHDYAQNYYKFFIIPFILVLFLSNPIRFVVAELLSQVAYLLSHVMF